MNWNQYYMEQAGYGAPDNLFRGTLYQRGYGLGGLFRKFFNWIVPIMNTHALPKVKEGAKEIGRVALQSVSDIAKDALAGKNIKESVQSNATKAVDTLKTKAEQALEGKGIKRHRKHRKKLLFKKLKPSKQDIFS